MQAHLSRPLLAAVRRLLAVLLSCAGGLDLLLGNAVSVGALLKALDPANNPYGPPLPLDKEPLRCSSATYWCICAGDRGAVPNDLPFLWLLS